MCVLPAAGAPSYRCAFRNSPSTFLLVVDDGWAPRPELPLEIRNLGQVVRLELGEPTGTAGVVLLDERFRRRPVGLLVGWTNSPPTRC
jgi:hypothetical protein